MIPSLSVVIPAYNEQSRLPGTLERVLAYLEANAQQSEILLVNDGSRDRTGRSEERRVGKECRL